MKAITVAIGLILLVLLVRSLLNLKKRPRDKHFDANGLNIDLDQIEENIHESDLRQYLRQAAGRGDYTLAVRLYYLALLKELSLAKMIRWKKDKTNRDYRAEMRPNALFSEFERLTLVFERVWYGSNAISQAQYEEIAPSFEQLLQKIAQTNPVLQDNPTVNPTQ